MDLRRDYLEIFMLANVCSNRTNTVGVLADNILQKFRASANDNDLPSLSGKSLRKRTSDSGAPTSNQDIFFDHLLGDPFDCIGVSVNTDRTRRAFS